jgi:hypothetical protein
MEPSMPDSARFALHRHEFLEPLLRGEAAIAALMKDDRFGVLSTLANSLAALDVATLCVD